jgi:hypothetical protein
MAIVIEQSLAGAFATPGATSTTSSWTPGANELCLALVANRGSGAPSSHVNSVTGNGLTWVKILEKDDTQNAITLSWWRAMGASPTAGGVTVNHGLFPNACVIQLIRLSGVSTTGTNGSGAIGATASADTGATDTQPATVNITTTANNSRVIGFGVGRGSSWTKAADFTNILVNQTANSGGSQVRSSTEYKDVATSGTLTTAAFTIASANDWIMAAIEVLEPSSTVYNQSVSGGITPAGSLLRQVGFHLAGGITPVGNLLNRVSKLLSGGLTPAGSLAKRLTRALAGGVAPSGTVGRGFLAILSGAVGSSGDILQRSVRVLTGTVASAGALRSATTRRLAGGLTPVGSLAKQFTYRLAGSVGSSGAIAKRMYVVLSGAVTSAGGLLKRAIKRLAGGLTPSASLSGSIAARVDSTKIIGYVEMQPAATVSSTKVVGYAELSPTTIVAVTKAIAYVELSPTTVVLSTKMIGYVEMTPIAITATTKMIGYVELQPEVVPDTPMPDAWFAIWIG